MPQQLAHFLSEANGLGAREGIDRWNPPDCGEIDMQIADDGRWFYQGSAITRDTMVRLFSSILRREGERYVLVTPVEKVGIKVDDVPFLAVEMAKDPITGCLHFRTNVDDTIEAGEDHPLRFMTDKTGGFRPYVKVRGDLWAKLTRALTFDLLELVEERTINDKDLVGIASGKMFFPIAECDTFLIERSG